MSVIEPYRQRLFQQALDSRDAQGNPQVNLVVAGRAKKNWKSADLTLAALHRLLAWYSPAGNQCFLLANDVDQAADDLELCEKLIKANPVLKAAVKITAREITRRDGKGYLLILPAQDVAGSHGGTYLFCGFDEIHAYKDWDLLEALQLDATRPDAMMWISSYASLFHKPGVPLFDLCKAGWAGTDPRMLFSWYGADRTTDPAYQDATPEARANPSQATFVDGYLAQQAARLPAHKFRRLHLNLPGLPEGSAFTAEAVMGSVARGITSRAPEFLVGRAYRAFVDMAGGSNDDTTCAIGYLDPDGRVVLARVMNQGPAPPYDPAVAVQRFISVLKAYHVFEVTGDAYAGTTFANAFQAGEISYRVAPLPAGKLYEAMEPILNAGRLVLLDHPETEQQLLGLIWRGGKIDHQPGEHDDYANAIAGLTHVLTAGSHGDGIVLAGRPTQAAVDSGQVPLTLRPDTPVMTSSDYRSLERQAEILSGPGADRSRGGLII